MLDSALSHDTYYFEFKFDSATIFYGFTYKEMMIYRRPLKFYIVEQIKKTVEHLILIHFTISF